MPAAKVTACCFGGPALDTLYINALAVLVTLGLAFGHKHYFEVALLIGLLGFIGTVVVAKFLLRRDITE